MFTLVFLLFRRNWKIVRLGRRDVVIFSVCGCLSALKLCLATTGKSGNQGGVVLLAGAQPRAEALRTEVYTVAEEGAISFVAPAPKMITVVSRMP
jgi:hypothetical protein